MALAKGRSAVHTGPVTLHTQTAIHIAQLMTQVTCPKPTPSPPISTHFCILIFSHESTGSRDDIIRSLCPQVLICRSPVFPVYSEHGTRLFSHFYIVLLLLVVLQVMESQWELWNFWPYIGKLSRNRPASSSFSGCSHHIQQFLISMQELHILRLLVKLHKCHMQKVHLISN